MQPPPNFHAAAPAKTPRKGPCINVTPGSRVLAASAIHDED